MQKFDLRMNANIVTIWSFFNPTIIRHDKSSADYWLTISPTNSLQLEERVYDHYFICSISVDTQYQLKLEK